MAAARWRVLALYAALNALMQLEWLRFAPVADATAAQYGVSLGRVAWLSLLFPVLFLPLALPAGALVDRLSVRLNLRIVAVTLLAGSALRVLVPGFAGLVAGQAVIALAQPLVMAAIASVARVWFAPQQQLRATTVGTLALFVGLAAAFVAIPATAADIAGSQRLDLALFAGLALAVFAGVPPDPAAAAPPSAAPAGRFRLLRQPALLVLFALVFLGNGFFNALLTWIEPLLGANGLDASTAGVVALAVLLGGVVGMALVPAVAARVSLRPTLSLAAVLAMPLVLLLARLHDTLPLCALGLVLGALLLAPLPLLVDAVTRIAGAERAGLALAAFWLAGNAGAAMVIYALSYFADHGQWQAAVSALAGVLALEAVVVWGLKPPPTTG